MSLQIAIPGRGELTEQSLPELLLSLSEEKQNCAVVVQRGGVRKEILLRDGEAVRIISTDPAESLSRFLGLGAAAQEVIFQHLQDHPNTFLEAIVARGMADREEITRRLGEAARQRLSECLLWDRGTYEILPLDPALKERPARKVLDLAEAIFEGLKGQADAVRSAAFLRPMMRARLRKTERFARFVEVFRKVFGEESVLARLEDGLNCEDLCRTSGDPDRTSCELYALLRSGLLAVEQLGESPFLAPLPGDTTRFFPGDPINYTSRPAKDATTLIQLAQKSIENPADGELRARILAELRDAGPFVAARVAEQVSGPWSTVEGVNGDLADLHYEVGRALEEVSSRLDLASERYRAALKLAPAHRLAQDALSAILRAAGDDEGRALLLAQAAQAEPDLTRRARLHRLRAELLADHLADLPGAEKELRAALALRPFDVDILEDMVALLERVNEGRKPPRSAALYLGRLARVHLAMKEGPGIDRGLSYLRRALEIDPENRDIWGLAERVLRAAGRWAELEELYRSAIPRSDIAGKEAMLRKLAGLEIFGRPGVGRWACEQLLQLDPNNTFARQRLRDLYEEANDHLARARLREEDIERAQNARGRNAARLELAELYLRRFGDVDRASVLIGDVLEEDPYHAGAYDLAHLYLSRQGHHPAYAEVLRRAVESPAWRETSEVQSPERVARAAELAWVLEALVKDPTRALSAWNRVLALAPGHAEARAAVSRLEASLSEATRELDELAQLARVTRKMSEKVEVLRRLGQKARRKDLDRAVQAYEELLEARSGDEEALRTLEEIYTARRDFGGLVSTLRRRIAVAGSDEARAGLLNRIAAISHERLGAPDQALRICREVLRVDAQNSTALGRMERIYSQLGNVEGLLGVLAHRAQVAGQASARAELYREMAKLAVKDAPRAATFWEQVLKENPGDREALLALEEIYNALRRDADLARVLSERAARTPAGDPELPLLLRRLAHLYESGAEDPVRALEAWERLLETVPEDPEALAAVAAAREAAGDTRGWVEIASRLLPRMRDPVRASALAARLAPALAVDLNRPEEADRILSAHLARMGVRGGDHARYLAKLREQRGDRRGALAALELEFLAEEAPPRRIGLAQRVATLWRDGVGDTDQAIEAFRRLCALDARSEAGWKALADLYDAARRDDDLVVAREMLISLASDPSVRISLLRDLAQIHEERRADPEAALACLKRACQAAPHDVEILRSFQAATARFGIFEPLASFLDAAGIPARERVRRFSEVAKRCLDIHNDITRAIACWRAAYERYPEEPEAFAGLSQIVEESGRYEALVEAFEARLGQVDPPERSRLLQKIGEICEQKLMDPDRAVASYRRAFEAAPDDPQAVAGYAKALEERGRWEEYIQLYERVALEAVDPEARGQALERVAQVTRQQLGDLSRTFEVKRRAFDLDRADPAALRELTALAEESGEWRSLAEVYEALVTRAQSAGAKLERLGTLAQLLEERLEDTQQAYARRLEAWQIDPRDASLKQEALRLAEKVGDFAPIINILLAQVGETNLVSEKVPLLTEAARFEEERRNDKDRAFALYLEAFLLAPRQEESIAELRRLAAEEPFSEPVSAGDGEFQGPRRWGQILGAYERLLAKEEDPRERVTYFHRIAEIFEGPLRDSTRAFEILELALHLDRQNVKTLDEMERLGRKPELTQRLITRLEEGVEKAQEARDAVPYLERLARVLDEVVGEPERASEILRRILAMQPGHGEARAKLREIQRRLGRFDELIALLEAEVAEAPPSVARREKMREIASLYEEVLKNPREAQALYAKVLVEDPTDYHALQNLARLHESFGEWRKLAETEARLAQLEKEPEAAAARFRRVAELYETQLNLPRRAVEAYRSALGFVEKDLASLRELARLLEAQRRWEELVEVLGRWAERETPTGAVPILVRRALLLAERLGNPKEAGEALRLVLTRDPQNPDARRGLIETLRLEKRFSEIASLVAEWEEQGPVEPRLLARLGEAYVDGGDDAKAKVAFSRALDADPNLLEALHGLSGVSLRAGEKAEAAALLRREAELLRSREGAGQEDLVRAAALYDEVAELCRGLGDLPGAREALRQALSADPKRLGAARRLLEMAATVEDFEAVRTSLQKLLEKAEGRERAQLFAELGVVEWRGYSRAEAALEAFEQALNVVPGLPAAVAGIAEVHRERGTWTEAVTLQRLLLTLNEALEKGLGRRDIAAGRLYYHFGHVKARLGELDDALTQLKRARERLGGDPEVTLGLAELCEEAGRTEEAVRYFQLFVSHPESSQRAERLAEAQLRLGLLLRRQGDMAGALSALILATNSEKVADRALPLASDLAEALGESGRAVELLARQIERTQAPAARRELFSRQAEAFIKQGDQAKAVEALQSAIAEKVGVIPFSLYARLLDHLGALGRWEEALSVAQEISSLTQNASPDDATVLNLRAAEIFSRTGQADRASRHIEAALAADPSSAAAFEALERYHRERGDFAALAETYRRRLAAFSPMSEERPRVQAELARVLLEDLKKPEEAIKESLEALSRLPDDLDVLDLAGRAAEAASSPLPERLSLFSRLVEKRPGQVDYLRRLGRLYEEHGDEYRSYQARAILHAFGVASSSEASFVETRRRSATRVAGGGGRLVLPEALLTPAMRSLGEVFADVLEGAPEVFKPVSPRGTPLSPLDTSPQMRLFADLMRLFPSLGLRAYQVPGQEIKPVRSLPAAVEIGEEIPKDPALLRFLLARAVVATRPAFLLFSTSTPEEGKRLFDAVIFAFDPSRRLSEAPAEARGLIADLREKVPARRRARLIARLAESAAKKEIPSFQEFSAALEATLNRVGLLYAGDFGAALRGIGGQNGEADLEARVSAQPVLADLIRFALSDAHAALASELCLVGPVAQRLEAGN